MKKRISVLVILALMLAGCSHEHQWMEADCLNPATCSECKQTEGRALGHNWLDATCTSAQKCTVCGQLQGEPLGHEWEEATCTDAETCINCGKTKGSALGHEWMEASCAVKKTCEVCGRQEGTLLEHTVEDWTIEKEATCSEAGLAIGICSGCGDSVEKNVDTIEHTPGEWVVLEEPHGLYNGTRIKECTVCGKQLESENFNWTAEEREAKYKEACKSYKYDEIARNPGKYKGEKAKFTGKVIQVMQSGYGSSIYYTLRVGIKSGYSYYNDVIYVTYTASESDARILEDDIITMYGELNGEKTYETTMGASVTIPYFLAEYIDIK